MGYIYTKSGKLAKRLYFGAVLLFEGLYYTFKNRVLADGGTFVENELPTISQDASLVLTPNAYKAGKLYSAVPNDGTGDFTVDRNSTATYIDEDRLIKTALANVPRIDWSTGAPVILREFQQTNLIAYSENFTISYWSNKGLETVSNAVTSPDGTINADKIIATEISQPRIEYQIPVPVSDITYTFSAYVKKGNTPFVGISTFSSTVWVIFNLDTITVVSSNTNTALINELSNGWFRISLSTTKNTSDTYNIWKVHLTDGIIFSDGIVDDYIYIWGAQLEESSTASSYIPTNGTTVTRLADNISVPTPAGVTSITETIDGVEQTPITTIPTTYSLPVGNINKVTML